MVMRIMQDLPAENISFAIFKLNGFYSLGEWRRFLFLPYFFMLLLSTTSNSILIFLIITQRALHSPMFVLIGLMAVVDLFMPIFFVPNMLLSFLFDWNVISLVGCLIQIFCVQYVGSYRSTLLLWMALDRFFAICRPLSYHNYMQMSNFLQFIILPVIRNTLLNVSVVSLAGKLHFCTKNEIDHCFCEHMGLVQLACGDTSINNLVGLATALLIPTTDFVFITISYVMIFASVMKSGKSSMKAINTCITHIIVITFSLVFTLMAFLSYRIRNDFSPNSRIFISTMYLFLLGKPLKVLPKKLVEFEEAAEELPQDTRAGDHIWIKGHWPLSLKSVTQKDTNTLPRVEETLDALDLFSSLDLTARYFQVAADEQDQEKTRAL
ncbi:olfactory receptor 52K1-like [Colossoma macropomum]|uniref:olfactory receptor 52K1-like n=1 Tax=Colossoma macropomum TaxID=42526 RepID=UPI001863CEFA|nr:olfactory receptor 52K1-like [Colossoma macropomum]